MIKIKTCPICGSSRIHLVRRTLRRQHEGKSYTVPNVQFHECPSCGEQLFDTAAIDKIQSRSPAFAKASITKRRKAG